MGSNAELQRQGYSIGLGRLFVNPGSFRELPEALDLD